MTNSQCVLTPRDMNILNYLFRFKIAWMDHIHQEFFKDVHYSAVTRRLRKLEKAKLIGRNVMLDKAKCIRSSFELTTKGLDKLKRSGLEVNRVQLKSNYPEHDLKLLELVSVLSKFSMVTKVNTENELLNDAEKELVNLRPDALLKLLVKGHPFLVAIEYELNAKSIARLKDKLIDYYQTGAVDAVFYLCETQAVLNKIRVIDQELSKGQKSKVFFCLAKDALSQPEKVTFTNSQGGEFTLM